MSRLRPALGKLALALLGLLLALGLAEIVFRVAGAGNPAELGALFDRRLVFYQADASRLNPWARQAAEGDRVLRVAVVGDSFTFGDWVDWDDAYPWRLERLLNLNAGVPPAEVRVFAASGTSTFQQKAFLPHVSDYGADLLILGIFLNDSELPDDPQLGRQQKAAMPRVPSGWGASLLRSSAVLGWMYQRAENLRVRRARLESSRHSFDRRYPGWKRFRRALRVFRDRCRLEDIRLVAVIFPVMDQLEDGYPYGFAHARIRRVLKRRDIPHLDLLRTFAGRSDLRMAAYPGIDPHPSEIAHRMAAHAIFEFLLEEGHLDPAYRPHTSHLYRTVDDWLGLVRRMRGVADAAPRP